MPAIVTFDPVNLLIIEINGGSPSVNELNAVEIYSEWKQALLDDPSRLGWPQAFSEVGGDPRTLTQNLGTTFFLENGWRIRPAEYSHKLAVNGNLFTREPGQSIFVATAGAYNVHTETVVSNIIDTMTVGGVDQATVQAALTAQGYTTARAPKIDVIESKVTQTNASLVLAVGLVTAGSTSRFVHTDILRDANSQIGLTLVIVRVAASPVARAIRTHDGAGIYEVLVPLVYIPDAGDIVFITSQWAPVRGTVR